ncbi:ATP-binding protein [Undibacterium sp. RTI2.1]|uniref:ATP-binding protein n=1 Tax=unclassified Undibacterium TaxID=2630295 RepID=UPI002AB3C70D|nr:MULTISPECIES: ATP-binding protein [unclassified Undibacterium]MDY7540213.1 ATP-binding protein [Undibacterium sp. 5I1]MEB0030387.1 ATP-binding protein [Undibacterium sp. RTI2.1]MEB0115332.1 ATP-binding protein [Undibacterium sp. RTI2.2]MEB0231431.1 ATP-binding protein [Undibacterium sp. 10I3]MEB0257140.1 ATP-binding protein [Undibacterium sp. 5I1]
MGRLFWKFFFFIWLAQVTGIVGIGVTLSLRHQSEQAMLAAGIREHMQLHLETGASASSASSTTESYVPPNPDQLRMWPEQDDNLPPHLRRHRLHSAYPPDGFSAFVPMVAALIVSLLFAALLAWYTSKPIRNLRSAFLSLAAGNLQTRVGSSMGRRRDELADLGREFDNMAEQLSKLMESQRRLLHDVSHELRSPLARLQAAIGLARQQPERVEATMERVEREAVRMDKLVGELLTLSRIEAGVMASMDAIQIDELLAEVVDNAGFEAESKHKQLVFSSVTLGGNIMLQGRYELLYRALENVVRNAIKHTAKLGIITFEVQLLSADQELLIRILDQGQGVPEDELQAIFEPFYRGSNSTSSLNTSLSTELDSNVNNSTNNSPNTRGDDGYGLGLAIAQRVILAHGGSISASNRKDGGLCVEIRLSLRNPEHPGNI